MSLENTKGRELLLKTPQVPKGSLVSLNSLVTPPKAAIATGAHGLEATSGEVMPPQGLDHTVLADENVSISPDSSFSPLLTEYSHVSLSMSPMNHPLETTSPTDSAGLPAPEVVPSGRVMRYLQAADALRQLDVAVEARILYLQREIRRRAAIHEEKRAELAKKTVLCTHLEKSTRRLIRKVRNLDSENDQRRERLEEMEKAIRKAQAEPAKRSGNDGRMRMAVRASGQMELRCGGTRKAEDMSSIYSVEHILRANINAYNRKIRLAEARHDELLDELHNLLARRKGRVAVYSRYADLLTKAEGSESGHTKESFHNRGLQEAEAVRRLESLINDRLRC